MQPPFIFFSQLALRRGAAMAFSNIHGFAILASKNLQDSYLRVRLYNGRMGQAHECCREATRDERTKIKKNRPESENHHGDGKVQRIENASRCFATK